MGRSRDIADFLSKTESTNTANRKLLHELSNVGVDSAFVLSQTETIGLTYYNTLDSLPITGLTSGEQAYVAENSRLYLSNGSGWYNAALIRIAPTMTLDPTGTITLATDGVTTSTVTIVAADSDTALSQLTYSVESDGNMLGRAVISQDSSVFTIRPLSSDSGATDGTFTLTFKTSDGVNFATDSADFSLTFATTIASSSATVLLMKAFGSGKAHEGISYQYGSSPTTDLVGFTTTTGTPVASSFSPYRSGGYSAHFDGTGDYLTSSSVYSGVGSSADFTAEAWIWIDPNISDTNPLILCSDNNGFNFGVKNSSGFKINVGHSYVGDLIVGSTTISTGTWTHIAAVRNSGTLKAYVNGVEDASVSDTSNFAGTTNYIASIPALTNYDFHGYVRDARFVSGTAVYTSAFTPPTEPLTAISGTTLLACHLPYFADGSTNGYTLTPSGNAHTEPFGPYDYNPFTIQSDVGSTFLTTDVDGMAETNTHQTISNFGSGDFTIEMWYYPTGFANYQTLYSGRANNSIYGQLTLFVNSAGSLLSYASSTGSSWDVVAEAGTTIKVIDKTWNHIAYVRNGNTWTIYVNGVGEVVSTNSGTLVANTLLQIGYENNSVNSQASGYISDYRIVKGSAVYTSNFTPPTEKLTWITNTTLQLQNTYDTYIYDAAAANRLSLAGDTQSSTSQRKFTTSSSVSFDGNGDYLTVPHYAAFDFGTGDYTIEFWINTPTSGSTVQSIVGTYNNGGSTGWLVQLGDVSSSLNIRLWKGGTNIANQDIGSAFSLNTWHHIAVAREGTSLRFFVDGVQQGTDTTNSTDMSYTSDLYIGKLNHPTVPQYVNGYIQDLRITKGLARYTANFTAPTAEFEL